MKFVIHFIAFLGVFLVNPLKSLSQDHMVDFTKMQEAYLCKANLSIDLNVKGFDEYDKMVFSMNLELKKNNKNFLIKSSLYDFLINDKYSVMILHEDKEITFKKISPEDNLAHLYGNISNYLMTDSMLNSMQNIIHLYDKGGIRVYKIEKKGGGIREAKLYINMSSYFIERVEYVYEEEYGMTASRVVIEYKNTMLPKLEAGEFSTENIFKEKLGGGYILSPKYKGYSLTDNKE